MKNIHDNAVNDIAECNVIHNVINPYKHTINTNSHYYPILHGCTNTRRGRTKYKTFPISYIVDVVSLFQREDLC